MDGLSQATRLSSITPSLSSGAHLPWREEMMDDETVDICTGLFLSVVSLIGLNGCNRQDPPQDAEKELPQVPGTAVGGMPGARSTRPRELKQCWKK